MLFIVSQHEVAWDFQGEHFTAHCKSLVVQSDDVSYFLFWLFHIILCNHFHIMQKLLKSIIIAFFTGQDTFVGDVDYQNLLRDEIPDIDLQTPIYE